MKKLLWLLVAIFTLSACKDNLPKAPFGLDWDMSEDEIKQILHEEPRIVTKNSETQYVIEVKEPELKNGEYVALFDNNKLSYIGAFYRNMRTLQEAERIFNYYESLFSQRYKNKSDSAISPRSHKLCIEKRYCTLKLVKYIKDDLVVELELVDTKEIYYSVYVYYLRKSYYDKKKKESLEEN